MAKIDTIRPSETSAMLRILADSLDREDYPDFVFIMAQPDDTSLSAFMSNDESYRMLGVIEEIKFNILRQMIVDE